RARDDDAAAGDAARQLGAALVQLAGAPLEPVRLQPDGVRAERVRLYDLGAGDDELPVHRLDEVRVLRVEELEAAPERDAALIEHRAHRAIAQHDLGPQA